MPEQDDRLSDELQDYYRQMTQQPAPDVLGRVMMSTDRRAARLRTWGAIGGGALAVAAVAGVIVLAFANRGTPSGVAPGHSSTPGPTVAPTSTSTAVPPTNTVVPVQQFPVGPVAHGFVPTDVTAQSAYQWWVVGYDGPTCVSASCTRILHTADAGQSFTSIPVPPVAPAHNGEQPVRLRFADAANGWLVSASRVVWATHDGGAHWTADSNAGSVADLEASGGTVYAVACTGGGQTCTVERSGTSQDSWSTLSTSAGHGQLNRLTVHGADVWVAINSTAGGLGWLLASTDGGQTFTMQTACPSALGFANPYAVSGSVLWATCATGTEAAAFHSVDGGQQFTQLSAPLSLANFASIAGVSSSSAVIGAQALLRTTDGGQTFTTVENNQSQWTIVGFTTPVNGFVFALTGSGQSQLWRTNDAGAHWFMVQFP
jgi:photosystem II stability/assembly factor-like uncharacterized protein